MTAEQGYAASFGFMVRLDRYRFRWQSLAAFIIK